ncbi:TPA_asm: peptidase S77/prohead core protein serine protease [Altiarchaeum virus]|nr:TPA_asm: peptidase S77/prohead core protein serine protease [Altiarchaeum virus]
MSEEIKGTIVDDIKNFAGDVNNLLLPVIFKNRLLFSAGEINGVIYSDEEIERGSKFDELPLFLDHNENVLNYLGILNNSRYEAGTCYGDMVVFVAELAKKILLGMKVGLSPRTSYLANVYGRKNLERATDTIFHSFSLVVSPADRKTMLNSSNQIQNNQQINMEQPTEQLVMSEKPDIVEKTNSAGKETANTELIAAKAEAEKVRVEFEKMKVEINEIKETGLRKDIENARNRVVNIECELGLCSPTDRNQADAEISAMSFPELKGMEVGYKRVQNFINAATSLDRKMSENHEMDAQDKGSILSCTDQLIAQLKQDKIKK